MYPQSIDKFTEKLNKVDGNTYVIEEEVTLINGVYEGELKHDNVSNTSIRVYTGLKLTGDKIENFIISTPSLTPWKKIIKIFSDKTKVYISYETQGDTVEADDINKLQESVVNTQTEIERYKSSNDLEVGNLKVKAENLENKKSDKTYVDLELNKRYLKDQVFTKEEVLQKIQDVIGTAPEALDTLQEIAKALNNDVDFAGTMTNELSKKVDKVVGKQLSTEDYTTVEKNKLAGVEQGANKYIHPSTHSADIIVENANKRFVSDTEKVNWNEAYSKKHEHSNKSILDKITQALLDAWDSAVTHISDSVRHITASERTLWNTVSNKVDKVTGKGLSTNDFDNSYKGKLDGIANGSTKVENSATNGNIKINGTETNVYTHPSGTNPHGTTKSDVGLSSVDNVKQATKTEFDAHAADSVKHITTAERTAWNAKSDVGHTHDDRYYTETEADSKFATKNELGSAGYGDMLKSAYDKNNNGKVDAAEVADTSTRIKSFASSRQASADTPVSSSTLNMVDYLIATSSMTTNKPPIGDSGILTFHWDNTGGYDSQLAIKNTDGTLAVRGMSGGTWSPWTQIAKINDIPTKLSQLENDGQYLKKGITWNDLKGV